METLDDLKAKLAAQGTALDSITTNVTGISGDIDNLKAQIAALQGGGVITQAQLDDLGTTVDAVGAKIDAIGTTTAALDAATPATGA